MPDKCKHCGKSTAKFPIKEQEEKTLKENLDEGTMIWKNLFKIDWYSLILIFIIIFMIWGYRADIAKCDDIMTNPHKYCDDYCNTMVFNQLLEREGNENLIFPVNLTVDEERNKQCS